ncbi:MAG: hypothetical protein JXR22_12530 [Prolixibacteraceae bacterium]|nr:hypothetical protein [Prolixibacteraceae bacterium]
MMHHYTVNDIEHLLKSEYSAADVKILFDLAARDETFFHMIWDMARSKPDRDAWRLLWILDHATEKSNRLIFPILDELYRWAIRTRNESIIRQTMKLILRCPLLEEEAGELLDRCVAWMNNPKAKISSQAMGLEFFFRVCQQYPEMKPELLAHIEAMHERHPSAGMQVRLREIRKALRANA